jgi:hypothetical protein
MIIVINWIEHLFELLSMLRNYKNRLCSNPHLNMRLD